MGDDLDPYNAGIIMKRRGDVSETASSTTPSFSNAAPESDSRLVIVANIHSDDIFLHENVGFPDGVPERRRFALRISVVVFMVVFVVESRLVDSSDEPQRLRL